MGPGFAASHSHPGRAERGDETGTSAIRLTGRVAPAATRLWVSTPLRWRLVGTATMGAAAAAAVGFTTSRNPAAAPANAAVELRVLVIMSLIAAGLYAQTSRMQARMGALLTAAGFLSALWLLNGSSNRLLFSIGVAFASVMPMMVAFLMLAHPTGRLLSRTEFRFLWLTGGMLAMLWLLGVAMTVQPPLKTPLLQCTPRCPPDVFSVGSAPDVVGVVRAMMRIAWLALAVGTPFLLVRRARVSSEPVRRSIIPVTAVAAGSAVALVTYLGSITAGLGLARTAGVLYASTTVAVPLAIIIGLGRERVFMGQVLAEFVNQLARLPKADPESLMAAALRDPSLTIAYFRPRSGTYVDSAGRLVRTDSRDEAVAWIERDGRPVAAVLYNPELEGFERFVRAAGAAALIRLEKAQLEADLTASSAGLAASRIRLVEMADAERRRLERDLHDGVQQTLIGLRIRLDRAAESVREDPEEGERVLATVGRQLDDVLQEVRSLARGIYPSLLTQRGLHEALKAAARNAAIPVEVHGGPIPRFPDDVEVAVYFCCLEALQNVAKHAGAGATAIVTLHEDGAQLQFEVRDDGAGFSPARAHGGSGLLNMRDRIEAVSGTFEVTSRPGHGTCVRGSVPVH